MTDKPDSRLLTKIDAVILRALEMDRDMSHADLEEFIFKEYGVEVSVKERLKEYTPPKPNNFLYWN